MTIRRADNNAYSLGTGLTGTGNPVAIRGGTYWFQVSGTPGGGGTTFQLEVQAPNGTWSRAQVFSGSAFLHGRELAHFANGRVA